MIIESIHIKNYRQYVDEKIVFAKPDGIKNLTIIQGSNASGKTNLLNAITWCLYGIEKHMRNKDLPILNISILERLKNDEIVEVCVEIIIIDDNLNRFIFNRTLNLRKSLYGQIQTIPDSTFSYPDGSKFKIIRQHKDEIIEVVNPNHFLNHLIPECLSEYFFVDGDRPLGHFITKNRTKISEDILNMSVKKAVIDNFRKKLEEQTKKMFFDLIMWKKEYYLDVKIDDKYDLSVIHQSSHQSIHALPISDQQILALSFIVALNNISGFHIPLIIDAPFQRISNDLKINLVEKSQNYLMNKQVILLVTEEEYTQDVRYLLSKRVGKQYNIFLDQMQGTSVIRQLQIEK